MGEIEYLTTGDVVALAELFFAQHGYARPILKAEGQGLLESAVLRAETRAYYGEQADLIAQAAALCDGIFRCHAFVDGNKRAAWIASATFLSANGYELPDGDDVAFANLIISIYEQDDHSEAEAQLASWLREHLVAT